MPGIKERKTNSEFIDDAARLLARLAMGAIDGDGRGSRFPPTAMRCASYFGNAVSEITPDPQGPNYSLGPGKGGTVKGLFESAASKLEEGVAAAAKELLALYFVRIVDDVAAAEREAGRALPRAEIAEIVADVLVRDYADEEIDGDGASLWIEFMRACYPDSAQLSAALRIAEGDEAIKGDSQAGAFEPWKSMPGTF